jgi:hypothetical protein
MGIIGCYTLTLYCDGPGCAEPTTHLPRNADFTGRNYSACVRDARRLGWRVRRTQTTSVLGSGQALCPDHAKEKP